MTEIRGHLHHLRPAEVPTVRPKRDLTDRSGDPVEPGRYIRYEEYLEIARELERVTTERDQMEAEVDRLGNIAAVVRRYLDDLNETGAAEDADLEAAMDQLDRRTVVRRSTVIKEPTPNGQGTLWKCRSVDGQQLVILWDGTKLSVRIGEKLMQLVSISPSARESEPMLTPEMEKLLDGDIRFVTE